MDSAAKDARISLRFHGSVRPRVAILASGLAAGLIASLAISALMLLAEKVANLPVGTFYIILVSALTQTQEYTVGTIAAGFLLHLAAGSFIGLAISAPFAASERSFAAMRRHGPAYGIGAGFALWLLLFMPVTYGIIVPSLGALDGQAVIRQNAPTGDLAAIKTANILSMMDRIIAGSLAFNVFYGLLAVMLTGSLAEAAIRRLHPGGGSGRRQVVL